MFGPFRLRWIARVAWHVVFGPPDDTGRPQPLDPWRDPYAYRPVQPRRGPGGRTGGIAVAEPDEEELLVMAMARRPSHR